MVLQSVNPILNGHNNCERLRIFVASSQNLKDKRKNHENYSQFELVDWDRIVVEMEAFLGVVEIVVASASFEPTRAVERIQVADIVVASVSLVPTRAVERKVVEE